MMGAQRYPKNYNGILAMAPVINWNEFLPSEIWAYLAMKKEKYAPPICELEAIQKAAVESCDELDGVKVSEIQLTVQRRVSDRLFVGRRGSRSRPMRLRRPIDHGSRVPVWQQNTNGLEVGSQDRERLLARSCVWRQESMVWSFPRSSHVERNRRSGAKHMRRAAEELRACTFLDPEAMAQILHYSRPGLRYLRNDRGAVLGIYAYFASTV